MDFRDRHVVVTGGAGALGAAVVAALLGAGAHCHVPHRGGKSLAGFAHRDDPRVTLAEIADLADEAAVDDYYRGLGQLWASIHVAGGFAAAPLADSGKAQLLDQLETNLVSAHVCSRAAALRLRALGAGGRIVNVAARQALEPRLGAGSVAYTVSKAAVAALTAALGQELVPDGILVNAVAPSTLDTPANRAAMPGADFTAWPKLADVAATILFLASPRNTVTRGAVVPVYGRA